MNIQTIGGILIAVGGIGLFISLLTLAGYAPWGDSRGSSGSAQPATTVAPAAGPPANIAPSTTVAPSINIATPAAMAAPPVAPAVNAAPPTNL